MKRNWLTSVILVAAVLGGALAGAHAHEREGKCPMSGMTYCCETAHEQGGAPEISMARLCCSLNCSEPGTTPGSSSGISPSPAVSLHTGAIPAAVVSPYVMPRRTLSAKATQQDSHPAYIRHLALLI